MSHLFHFNLIILVHALGYSGLFTVIFAESGLFFGFFLPGASLLFAAGIIASHGLFNVWILILLLAFAAILGDNVGYWFGAKTGPAIFTREDSIWFHKKHIEEAEVFYEKYGPPVILLARFIPIVRTFAPILAGVGKMEYRKFFFYNIVGGIAWTVSITYAGYVIGEKVPDIFVYLPEILLLIIVITSLPLLKGLHLSRKAAK